MPVTRRVVKPRNHCLNSTTSKPWWWLDPRDRKSTSLRYVGDIGPYGRRRINHFATMALCSGPHCECVGSDSPIQRAKPILGNFGIKLGFLSNSTYLAAILFFLVTMAIYRTLEGSKRISYLYTFKKLSVGEMKNHSLQVQNCIE